MAQPTSVIATMGAQQLREELNSLVQVWNQHDPLVNGNFNQDWASHLTLPPDILQRPELPSAACAPCASRAAQAAEMSVTRMFTVYAHFITNQPAGTTAESNTALRGLQCRGAIPCAGCRRFMPNLLFGCNLMPTNTGDERRDNAFKAFRVARYLQLWGERMTELRGSLYVSSVLDYQKYFNLVLFWLQFEFHYKWVHPFDPAVGLSVF